ncbi:MAG: carbohydrate kinase family protein, partial [Chloroflexi bacterium]|nr:carbohydrate kinase family protein [Chloroflexota bacterium]
MTGTFDVIVSGHLCLDLIPEMSTVRLADMAMPGQLLETGPIGISTGGTVSNTGLALHRLGVNVGLMATVGDDLLGSVIRAFLDQRDPRLGELLAVQRGGASSYSVVLSPQDTDRVFLHCTGTNTHFNADHIDFDVVAHARIFHLGYPPLLPRMIAQNGQEMRSIFQRVQANGTLTSVDMALPDPGGLSGQANWPAILRNTLPYVDIFLPSIEEIIFMLRRPDYDTWRGDVLSRINGAYLRDLVQELLEMGCTVAGFKLGERGLYLRTAQDVERLGIVVDTKQWAAQEQWVPAFGTDVVGTTGAGDSAYAGFLAALLR